MEQLNPLVTNGISHPYHLDESIFIFKGIRSNISFLFHLSMKFTPANRKAPDGTPRFAASHLGLFCLPMSHKKDARRISGLNPGWSFTRLNRLCIFSRDIYLLENNFKQLD